MFSLLFEVEGGRCVVSPLLLQVEIETVATRCKILRLKFTKFDFGWSPAPDSTGGVQSIPPDPYLDLRGHTSKGQRRKRKRNGKELRGGDSIWPPSSPPNFLLQIYAPVLTSKVWATLPSGIQSGVKLWHG